jgi:hypothetical protein
MEGSLARPPVAKDHRPIRQHQWLQPPMLTIRPLEGGLNVQTEMPQALIDHLDQWLWPDLKAKRERQPK